MTKDSFLAPINYIDEKVHTQFQRLGDYFESKGVTRADLGLRMFNYCLAGELFSSLVLPILSSGIKEIDNTANPATNIPVIILAASHSLIQIHDLWYSAHLKEQEDKIPIEDAVDPFIHYSRIFQRGARKVYFGLGGFLTYEIAKDLMSNGIENITSARNLILSSGVYITGTLASSMYIKDNEPSLLKKTPFWKKHYDTWSNLFKKTKTSQ